MAAIPTPPPPAAAQTRAGSRDRFRAWAGYAIKAVVGLALLAVVVTRVPLADATAAIAAISIQTAAVVIALTAMAHLISAARLVILLPAMTLGQGLRFTLIGLLYATVLPSPLAGDAVKAVRLARVHVEPAMAAMAVVRDKLLGLAALALLALVAALRGPMPPAVVIAAAGVFGAVIGLWLAFDHAPRLAARFGFSKWLGPARFPPSRVIANFGCGVGFQILCAVIFAILGDAVGLDLDVTSWVVVYATVTLVLLVPVTIAGLGLREGTLVAVLALFGQPQAAALALSLCLLILGLLGAAAGWIAELTGRDRAGAV